MSCAVCSKPIRQPTTGRRRRWCSDACKQADYRKRRAVVWPPDFEQAEERVVSLIVSGEAEPWRALEQLALGWRAAA